MTCKDCYHYGHCRYDVHICKNENGEYIQFPASNDVGKVCEGFKDKSRIVELPCKVGWVYVPWHWDGEQGIALVEVEEIKIYDSQNHIMFFIDMQSDDEEFNQAFGGWKIEKSVGDTVFLTREEAEEALRKERENRVCE